VTAKLKPLNFDYERIFQAQQGFKKHSAFAGQFNALVSPHQGQLCNEAVTTRDNQQPLFYWNKEALTPSPSKV
jgi:hypothetical protein